ncbi:MAG: HIT family protein [bacterium]|nr:HIT family protein [bacterium]
MDCIFCKIVAKEIQGKIIYENDAAIGVLDTHPIAPGHTLVVSKVHVFSILDLEDDQVEPVFVGVKRVAELLSETLKADGFTYGINQGEVSGQTIPHFHVHVVPRWRGDGGMTFHGIVDNPPKETLDSIYKKIKNK